MRLHRESLTYAATSFGARLIHVVFSFYYVKIYTQRFHVTEAWFQTAQVVFMVWNAINDPLFGYLQDNYNFSVVRTRRHSILYAAPFFALSFLMLWFPWGDYDGKGSDWLCGVQLMVGLCFYDTVFTFSQLAHCALFTEICRHQMARVRLVRYSQVASLIGSSSVFIVNKASRNATDYTAFLVVCVTIAVISCVFMIYTGLYAVTPYDVVTGADIDITDTNESDGVLLTSSAGVERQQNQCSALQQTLEIFKQRDFVVFVLTNFCQNYHATFLANFSGVFCDFLVSSEYLSVTQRSIFYGSMFALPKVAVIVASPLVHRFGYFRIFRTSFRIKILLGITLFLVGPKPYAVVVFFLLERIVEASVSSLFNLPVSDIIDQDRDQHDRSHPMSSTAYGANAVFTKPAISFAPMITVSLLNFAGYERITTHEVDTQLHRMMFILACITPVFVGTVQALVWSQYTIRDSHLIVKSHIDTQSN